MYLLTIVYYPLNVQNCEVPQAGFIMIIATLIVSNKNFAFLYFVNYLFLGENIFSEEFISRNQVVI